MILSHMRFHCLQHVAFETPGYIQTWITENGHDLSFSRLDNREPLPQTDQFEALIVMGGPMSAYQEARYPWLKAEKEFIAASIKQQKKVLGICLGAQLVAQALGARVYRNRYPEIGFFPVDFLRSSGSLFGSLQGSSTSIFHWHADTFDLPRGSIQLARSAACQNQAFSVSDQVLGLQFHVEVNSLMIRAMVEHGMQELVEGPYVQGAHAILNELDTHQDNKLLLYQVLNAFFI
jgi:GMP synthase-like glutamine amidotransferase